MLLLELLRKKSIIVETESKLILRCWLRILCGGTDNIRCLVGIVYMNNHRHRSLVMILALHGVFPRFLELSVASGSKMVLKPARDHDDVEECTATSHAAAMLTI
jgi:hypothetical protein